MTITELSPDVAGHHGRRHHDSVPYGIQSQKRHDSGYTFGIYHLMAVSID
jgi:hypothetical protein